MKRATLLLTLVAASAFAQQAEPTEPPIIPVDAEAQPPPVLVPPAIANAPLEGEEVSYSQRCFAVPAQVWVPLPTGRYRPVVVTSAPLSSLHAATPIGPTPTGTGGGTGNTGGGSGESSSSSSSGGLGDGKAILVLAVVLVAVLPVVVYALDKDAPAVVTQRFHCPTLGFDGIGGADFGKFGIAAAGSGRVNLAISYFGAEFQFELSGGSINSWSAHLMARIGPKAHIQPNIAFGFRSMTFGSSVRRGLELGVPHRYIFNRDGLKELSLELRPTFMFGLGTFDVGLEAAMLIPLFEPLHLRVGGKVQSFGDDVIGGVNAGLSFTL